MSHPASQHHNKSAAHHDNAAKSRESVNSYDEDKREIAALNWR